MKVITYLGFTLLSIVVQFTVMDYIQERSQSQIAALGVNGTSQPKRLSDVMKEFSKKQHALYYRTHSQLVDNTALSSSTPNNVNSTSLDVLETTTDLQTTFIDVVFDENVTEESFTTDSMITSTEFENFTDISFFPKRNQTTIVPKTKPKEVTCKEIMCSCNLLVNVCDINCCCDSDCSKEDHKMFRCENMDANEAEEHYCYPQLLFTQGRYSTNSFESLFCIAKTNLPEKRNIHQYKQDPFAINQFLTWHTYSNTEAPKEFKRKMYEYGDLVWVLQNGSLSSIDLPTSTINNYCNGRRHIQFLINDNFKCNVKLNDLEMFNFLKTIENQRIVSMRENSLNNTTPLNCTNVHCTKWTILICNGDSCTNYNKTLHEALCTDFVCIGVALKLELNFHYYNSKITNATIKLYTQRVSTTIPFMAQDISVKFYLTNESVSHVVQLSGNPGYLTDSPILVSFAEQNFTEKFFNSSVLENQSVIMYPINVDGVCVVSNMSKNYVKFNSNKRMKCRYYHNGSSSLSENKTDLCTNIQQSINNLLGMNKKLYVSPFGNPANLKDNEWIPLQTNLMEVEPAHSVYHTTKSKLLCYNLITRISLIFTFADMSDTITRVENKILSAMMEATPRNVTLNAEDISTPLTVDIAFIDITKPGLYEFAEGPHLDIHLPKDFFFPFHNAANTNNYVMTLLLCLCHIVFF